MKRAWWSLAGLVILAAFGMGVSWAWKSKDYSRAKANIPVLASMPGIEFVSRKTWDGTRIWEDRLENRLRRFIGKHAREEPFFLEQHEFRNAAGRFSVGLWENGGQVYEISIYGDPSTGLPPETMAMLKKLFPDADYHAKP